MHFPLNDGGRRRGKIQRYKDRSGIWTCGLRYYPNDLVTGAAENRIKQSWAHFPLCWTRQSVLVGFRPWGSKNQIVEMSFIGGSKCATIPCARHRCFVQLKRTIKHFFLHFRSQNPENSSDWWGGKRFLLLPIKTNLWRKSLESSNHWSSFTRIYKQQLSFSVQGCFHV